MISNVTTRSQRNLLNYSFNGGNTKNQDSALNWSVNEAFLEMPSVPVQSDSRFENIDLRYVIDPRHGLKVISVIPLSCSSRVAYLETTYFITLVVSGESFSFLSAT